MPSPFPGMDPYLEARSLWPDVHQRMITYIAEHLQPQLRPTYVARIGERIQLAETPLSYVPDLLLVQTLREPPPILSTAAALSHSAAAARPRRCSRFAGRFHPLL